MRRGLLVASLAGILLCIPYLAEGLRLPWGNGAQPGPGFYPFLVGVLLLVGCLGTGLEAALRPEDGEVNWPTAAAGGRVLAIALAALGYVAALRYLGHALSATLVTLVVLQVMGQRRWLSKIGLALLFGVGSYYLFGLLFGVPLPAGALFE